MKSNFTIKCVLIGGLMLTMPLTLSAAVKKSTVSCNSGMSNVQCRIVQTRTNYRNNGSGDWLKSNDTYQFRSTNGKFCKIKGSLTRATNAKLVYSSTNASRSGDWGGSGIQVSQKKEGRWDYSINWNITCK